MTEHRDDWARWRGTWQAGGSAPGGATGLAQRAAAERRRAVLVTGAEIVFAVTLLVAIADLLPRRAVDALWVGAMLALLGLAAAFAATGPGHWRVSYANTTEAFLRLTAERCRRALHALRFVWILLAIEVLIHVFWVRDAWRRRAGADGEVPEVWVVVVAAASVLAVAAWSAWRARAVRARLARTEAQLAELLEEDPPASR